MAESHARRCDRTFTATWIKPPKKFCPTAAISSDKNSYQGLSVEQLTLSFEPGLSKKHRSIRDCLSTSIYKAGLERVAAKTDYASSNLSRAISDDPGRKYDVNEMEAFFDKFGDYTAIWYLVDKYLVGNRTLSVEHLLAKADVQMADFRATLEELKRVKR